MKFIDRRWKLKTFIRLHRQNAKIFLRKLIYSALGKPNINLITRAELSSHNSEYTVHYFGEEEVVAVDKPYILAESKEEIKEIYPFQVTLGKPFICEIPEAELVGSAATGFDRQGNLITETVVPLCFPASYFERYVSLRTIALRKLSRPKVLQLNTACSLVSLWGDNYWHWMVDCLPRLEALEAYQEHTGVQPTIIVKSALTSWQIDSLKLLGYNPAECIPWNRVRAQVRKLLVPSFQRHWDDCKQIYNTHGPVISPRACSWIRQRVLSNLPDPGNAPMSFSSKIFISRRRAVVRRVFNEAEVMKVLAPLGFVAYVLEELSFTDKVRLFAQAKIVISNHGAGMTNMIFSQHLTVIELFGSFVLPGFANLARGLGFRYACLKGQSHPINSRQFHTDIVVNIADLRNLIAKIEEPEPSLICSNY